ncbi:MAG: ATP-binding cassette domain-containing protein [Magnetococcales bacterium]|nr:ATP-binding cassette domain-containing protein [Magnetococcales bacterium]MBF0150518.1 ATP-binding cassette domain-containing protein [Magnetococcales bacterium]
MSSLVTILRSPWWQAVLALPGFKNGLASMMTASLAINLTAMALPITLMQVYDRILANKSTHTLIWLVFGCVVAILLEAALRLARAHISGWQAARFEHKVGMQAIHQVVHCPLIDYERHGVGVHLERLEAVQTLRGFYAGQIFQILLDLPFALLFLATIAVLGGHLVWAPILLLVTFLMLFINFRKNFNTFRSKQLEINDRRYNFLIETLAGIHLVKSLAFEEQMMRRYERLQNTAATTNMNVTLWSNLPIALGSFVSQAMTFVVILAGGGAVMSGSMTLGTLTACSLLAGRALQPVQMAVGFWLRFSDAQIAQGQVQKIFDMPRHTAPDSPPFPADIEGTIHLHELSFTFRPDTPPVLKDIELHVPARTMLGIRATSSSGATTLSHLLMGLIRPTTGTVFIDDYNLEEWDHTQLRGRVEYLPQNGVLFPGTILENIALFDAKRLAAANDAANLLGLNEMVASLPQGYGTEVTSQSNTTLPMGLIQRIALARCFVMRPRVVIFDKANAALDRDSAKVFLEFFTRLKGQCTLILLTESPELLAMCDQTFELAQGSLRPLPMEKDAHE